MKEMNTLRRSNEILLLSWKGELVSVNDEPGESQSVREKMKRVISTSVVLKIENRMAGMLRRTACATPTVLRVFTFHANTNVNSGLFGVYVYTKKK